MSYDPALASRLDKLVGDLPGIQRKNMFGGVCWLVSGNMFVGVHKDWLIARVGEEEAAPLLEEEHVKPMDITGKPMKGWVMVAPAGIVDDHALERHVRLAFAFASALPPK